MREGFQRIVFSVAILVLLTVGRVGIALAEQNMTYKIYCARCHGDGGHGDGPDASTLSAHPRDFTDCTAMAKVSDETMFKAIKEGGAAVNLSGEMPAWGSGLSDDEIKGLMQFIRGLCKR